MSITTLAVLVLVAVHSASATSDDDQFEKAKQECAPQLAGLAPCLGYVGGEGKAPSMDCCTATKQVLAASKKCVCLLVKYKDEPGLGIKFDINRVLSLPSMCQSPAKLTECPTLLHLSPNSTEAKMFENYDKASRNVTTTASSTSATATATPASTSSDTKSKNGAPGRRTSLRATAVFYGVVVAAFFSLVCSI